MILMDIVVILVMICAYSVINKLLDWYSSDYLHVVSHGFRILYLYILNGLFPIHLIFSSTYLLKILQRKEGIIVLELGTEVLI